MLLQCAAYFEIIFLLKSSDDQAATRDAYRVAKQQRVTARRALEWIGTLKARLVFRYEISDLFCWSRVMISISTASHLKNSYEHYKTHENPLQQESSDSFISELPGTDCFAFLKMSGIYSTSRSWSKTHEDTLSCIPSGMQVTGGYWRLL